MPAPTPDQQNILDTQWDRVSSKVMWYKINGKWSLADFLQNCNTYLAPSFNAVIEAIKAIPAPPPSVLPATLKSQVDGKSYAPGDYLISIDRKQSENAAAVAALSAKLDAVLAAVPPKVTP